MRNINEIIVHTTATVEGRDYDVAAIRRMHIQRGWSDIGYHFLIGLDGNVMKGRPVEQVGAHVAGRNANTIGVSYVGGIDKAGRPKDTRTHAQKAALEELLIELVERFPGISHISGHRDYANKACPSFDATKEYRNLIPVGRRRQALRTTPEPVKVRGAVGLLSAPFSEDEIPLPKNATVELTGRREGDWVEAMHQGEIGFVHEGQLNQREVPESRAKSRTILGNLMAAAGVIGTAMAEVASQLRLVAEERPVLTAIAVTLAVGGVAFSLWAKIQDTGAGKAKPEDQSDAG